MMRRLPRLPVRMKFSLIRFHPPICTRNALHANRSAFYLSSVILSEGERKTLFSRYTYAEPKSKDLRGP